MFGPSKDEYIFRKHALTNLAEPIKSSGHIDRRHGGIRASTVWRRAGSGAVTQRRARRLLIKAKSYPGVEHARVGLWVGEGIQGVLQMFILLGLDPAEPINSPSRCQCSLCACIY